MFKDKKHIAKHSAGSKVNPVTDKVKVCRHQTEKWDKQYLSNHSVKGQGEGEARGSV